MNYQSLQNLALLFLDQAERFQKKPFLWTKRNKKWTSMSWQDTADQVKRLSRGLRAMGLQEGDRVVILSENRPEWLIMDIATIAAGGITVPAYTTHTIDDLIYVIDNSGAVGIVASTPKLTERAMAAAKQCPCCHFVVHMEDFHDAPEDPGFHVYGWQEALDQSKRLAGDDVREVAARRKRTDTAAIIYTSGTGGAPKGVMLSSGSIIANVMGAHDVLEEIGLGDEIFLSFLPLSHAYEHTGGQFFPIALGAQIYYAEGVEKLAENITEVRPTIMTAVPRLYEALHLKIVKGVEKAGGKKAELFQDAVTLGLKRLDDEPMSFGERTKNLLLDVLVRRKVQKRFGGRLKAFVSGGAPLNPEIGRFFLALGIRLLQGYGQTEASPVIAVNRPHDIRIETVGNPLKGVTCRIADDGELLVQGECVMNGYWANPETTAQTIRNGWLHTGDIATMSDDGFITITDRKKDIIVNSGGDNISPQKVEGYLNLQPEFSQSMVYGDRKPYLVALLVLEDGILDEHKKRLGTDDVAAMTDDKDFRKVITTALERANARLSTIEKVRKFIVVPEPFSPENDMLTPTLKIRRHVIRSNYGLELEKLYQR
ncbi:MAG: AMP-dependent synthetase/ligase [Alphaproteobacteria bacterium]|nr:AMP-dependent synthetase/ligase [Alphaproteobacteria bacterium]